MGEIGGLDQSLARDAADAQAHPADPGGALAVDQRHGAAELGRAQGRHVAARAGAGDDEVGGFGNLADDHQR